MDYVQRKLEQARQQRLEANFEAAMKQQRQSPEDAGTADATAPAAETPAGASSLPSMLLGVAVGALLTAAAVMVYVQVSGARWPGEKVDVLDSRLASLSDQVAALENRLTGVVLLADSLKVTVQTVADRQKQEAARAEQADVTAAEAGGAGEAAVAAPAAAPETTEPEDTFTPTHTVTTALNLRPSADVGAAATAILPPGTQVQKIGQQGPWYRVATAQYGQGWVAARYLSAVATGR